MSQIYKNFVEEELDEKGNLKKITFKPPKNFNFGYDCVDALAFKTPNKTAMIWLNDDQSVVKKFSFSEIKKYTDKTANYFLSLGIKKGDVVMLILKRHYQFWFSIIALHKIGAVALPATHQLMKKDLVYRFNKADVKAVICTSDDLVSDEIFLAEKECPKLKVKVIVGKEKEGWHNFNKEMELANENLLLNRDEINTIDDPMLMYFSSGTTGYPKCVAHNFAYPLGHIVTAKYWHNVEEDGIHLTISDTGWGKAVWGKLYGQWLAETCIFVYDFERFHADKILPLFKDFKITTFCAPPTMYRFFIKEDIKKYDMSSLHYCTIAGEALNPEVYKQWEAMTGLKLMEGFGQTETTLAVANLRGMNPKPGSMGKPNPQYNIRLLMPDGADAKMGEIGEICIDTKNLPIGLFKSYYMDEETTSKVWNNNLYHTGDVAWTDEDGYFWYVGRTDDLIKSSGYRIGPFEIESVIMELPEVLEVAVTGVPDAERGQIVKATIVLSNGYSASEELIKKIQNYVKVNTAPYKYPRKIEFVTDLPKTISGKIIRKDIKK